MNAGRTVTIILTLLAGANATIVLTLFVIDVVQRHRAKTRGINLNLVGPRHEPPPADAATVVAAMSHAAIFDEFNAVVARNWENAK